MKLIAVSQRTLFNDTYREKRDALDQRWSLFLNACDMVILLIPNNKTQALKLLEIKGIDGVLLTGGGEDEQRVEVEHMLLEYAIQKNLPLVGVCHGMQLLQKYFGLSLYPTKNHVAVLHEIYMENEKRVVNSYHTMGTVATNDELIVTAKSKDGIIKGIQHKKLPLFGIMWHPEREEIFHDADIDFFKRCFGAG